jgi:hypothetical protein
MSNRALRAVSHVPPIFPPPDVTKMQGYTSRLSGV